MEHIKLDLSLDGNKYCVLEGKNLQDGIAGFGETRLDAFSDYLRERDSKHECLAGPECWCDDCKKETANIDK